MHTYTYTVDVVANSLEEAETVMAERLNHDEDYGFEYEVGWMHVRTVVAKCPVRDSRGNVVGEVIRDSEGAWSWVSESEAMPQEN